VPGPVQDARYAEILTSALGLQGKLPLEIDEVAVPAFILSDLADIGLSHRSIWRPAWGGDVQSAGGAGTEALFQFFNPADSGTLVVLDAIVVSIVSAGQILVAAITSLTPAAATRTGWRDTRLEGGPVAQYGHQTQAAAAPANVRYAFNLPALTGTPVELGVYLMPGTGIEIHERVGNTTMTCSFRWRERHTFRGED